MQGERGGLWASSSLSFCARSAARLKGRGGWLGRGAGVVPRFHAGHSTCRAGANLAPCMPVRLALARPQAVKGRPMSSDEVNLLYRVFDSNRDGFLEISGAPPGLPLLHGRMGLPLPSFIPEVRILCFSLLASLFPGCCCSSWLPEPSGAKRGLGPACAGLQREGQRSRRGKGTCSGRELIAMHEASKSWHHVTEHA